MTWVRRNQFAVFALAVVLGLIAVTQAVATDAGGEADQQGAILLGTGFRLFRGVDYNRYVVPDGAIGATVSGDVLLDDWNNPGYPTPTCILDVYARVGVVNGPYALTWVFSGSPQVPFVDCA